MNGLDEIHKDEPVFCEREVANPRAYTLIFRLSRYWFSPEIGEQTSKAADKAREGLAISPLFLPSENEPAY